MVKEKLHDNPGMPGTNLEVDRNNLKVLCYSIWNRKSLIRGNLDADSQGMLQGAGGSLKLKSLEAAGYSVMDGPNAGV